MHRLRFGPCRRVLTVACCLFVSFMATRAAIANGTTSSSTSPANNPDNNENMELVQLGSLPYWDAAVARQYSKNSNSSSSTSLSGGPAQHNNVSLSDSLNGSHSAVSAIRADQSSFRSVLRGIVAIVRNRRTLHRSTFVFSAVLHFSFRAR